MWVGEVAGARSGVRHHAIWARARSTGWSRVAAGS